MYFFDANGVEIQFGDLVYVDAYQPRIDDPKQIIGIFECYKPELAEDCPEYQKMRQRSQTESERSWRRWFDFPDRETKFFPTLIIRELNNPKMIFKRSLHGVRKVPDPIAMVLKLEKATRDENDA